MGIPDVRPMRVQVAWRVRDWRFLWLRKRTRRAVIFNGYVREWR